MDLFNNVGRGAGSIETLIRSKRIALFFPLLFFFTFRPSLQTARTGRLPIISASGYIFIILCGIECLHLIDGLFCERSVEFFSSLPWGGIHHFLASILLFFSPRFPLLFCLLRIHERKVTRSNSFFLHSGIYDRFFFLGWMDGWILEAIATRK